MFERMIKKKMFCGLDIGSQQIKASLIIQNADAAELLGVFETKTDGLKHSAVSDITELTESVHLCMTGLMKKTGTKIKDLYLGIGGDFIEGRKSSAVIPLLDKGSKVIGQGDIRRVNSQARQLGVKMEEQVLHDFPQYYRADDMNPTFNAIGLYGRKLEAGLLMVVAKDHINNIIKAVNQAGYDIAGLFFTSLAAGEACLSKKKKADGSVLVDIGLCVTNVLIFKDGVLRYFETIPMGGDHVTRSIAHNLNLSFDLAEDIKKSYAVASTSSDAQNDEEILVKKETTYIPIRRELIFQAIEPEIKKFVMCIDDVIKHSKYYDELNDGVLMVGGGSLLPGLIECIEERTNLPVTMGKAAITASKTSNAAVFLGAVGLAQLGLQKTLIFNLSAQNNANWANILSNKVKEVYQDYF